MTCEPPAIRLASPADHVVVAALVRAFHLEDGHPISDQGLAALITLLEPGSDHGRVLVLDHAGELCGYAALCFGYSIEYGGRDAFVDDLYVAPSLRGRGHGARLYAALEAEARAAGCRALHLEVMPGNAAERWYRRLGFADRASALLTRRLPG